MLFDAAGTLIELREPVGETYARIAREHGYHEFVFSMKASNPKVMIEAYRLLVARLDAEGDDWNYPIHLGVTEAGPPPGGLIKSVAGIATLLLEGIGDTIRFSLTADPIEEGKAGRQLLEYLGLRERTGLDLIACPSCGRAEVDQAVDAASAAFQSWRRVPPVVRARHLNKLLGLFEDNFEAIAQIVTKEHGKTLPESRGSVRRGIECIEVACGAPSMLMGQVLEEHIVSGKRTLDRSLTYQLVEMLQGVMDQGTGAITRRMGFSLPAAGKTGTTNGYRDAWFTGFTPTLSTAVWVGFDKKKGLRDSNGTGITGGRGAAPIWADFMIQATSGEPARKFTIPADIHFEQADPTTGYLAAEATEHPLRVALKENQRLNAPPGKQHWEEESH